MSIVQEQPSEDSQIIQAVLEEAVSNALEKNAGLGTILLCGKTVRLSAKAKMLLQLNKMA